MLNKSKKYGTVLTVGPRLKRLIKCGLEDDLLWGEKYPEQEEPTEDGSGEFQHTRLWIEKASLEVVFDLWCRGQNLIGYSELLLDATEQFRRICEDK